MSRQLGARWPKAVAGHLRTASDRDGALGQLAQQGIEPEREPYTVREGGNRLCFVRDPDGYRIELIETDPATE